MKYVSKIVDLNKFLADKKNVVGINRALTLARLNSQSLILSNKVGAVIVNLETLDIFLGYNYTYGALERYKDTQKDATLANLKLHDIDDNLEPAREPVHAIRGAIERLVENHNDSVYQDLDLDVLEESFDGLDVPKLQKDSTTEQNGSISMLRDIIIERLNDIDSYARELEELLNTLSSKIQSDYLACFVTKEPCEQCKKLLIENNIYYLGYPEQGVFKLFEVNGDSYTYLGTNSDIQI